ncbi:MAG: aminotransferase class V-fold PLP-dependent enzyme [Thermoprotei archaeon]
MKVLPDKSTSANEVFKSLQEYTFKDFNPLSGRMYGHYYAAGAMDVIEIGRRAYVEFMDKTMLDFTVYPSVLKLENDVVGMVGSLLGGNEDTVGTFTYGGTESIMIAIKAAREFFKKKNNTTPEIILPSTAHPAFYKAAEYLGLKPVRVNVDHETFQVNIESVKNLISDNTAVIVGSAPNYPFGVIDDIKALSEIAIDKKVWLHVDACIGGFILPFFKELGEKIPPFDFSLEGVASISADLHKYGYAPKGASIVLFRNAELREGSIFVMSSWPGYPIVNTTVLSTRSAGTLAGAWAVLNYLGKEGYIKLAKRILDAKRKIIKGLSEIGFKILGNPLGGIIAFTSDNLNISALSGKMASLGWYVQFQPGSKLLGFPKSIHLTLMPVHSENADKFLNDLKNVSKEISKTESLEINVSVLKDIGSLIASEDLVKFLGLKEGELPEDLSIVNELMHVMPPEIVENILRKIINEYVFRPSRK